MDLQKEREAFEAYMAEKYKNLVDRRQCLNNGGGYMAWDMNVAWRVWQAAKAQAVPEWISVDDRLPNRQVNVLVASKHDFVCIASLTNNHKNNKFYDGDGFAINSITHWMPLPKPPKAQEPSDD